MRMHSSIRVGLERVQSAHVEKMAGVPGGLGPVNESTPEVQEVADKVS